MPVYSCMYVLIYPQFMCMLLSSVIVFILFKVCIFASVCVCHWNVFKSINNTCISTSLCVCHWNVFNSIYNACIFTFLCVCHWNVFNSIYNACIFTFLCVCHWNYMTVCIVIQGRYFMYPYIIY